MLKRSTHSFYTTSYRESTSQKISWGHWFVFFNIIWAIVIGSRYAFISDWPSTLLGRIYFFISIIGHFSSAVFIFYLLLLFPLSFIIKNERTFRHLSVILATLIITVLLVDTQVFTSFHLHLSSLVWNLVVNPDNGSLSRDWQLFFAPMPLILLMQMLFARWSWDKLRSLNRQKWVKPVSMLFILSFIATHLLYAWADATFYRPITMQRSILPLSYPMTARTFLEQRGFLNKSEHNATEIETGRIDTLSINYPKTHLVYAQPTTKPNILFITISGLRYDAISRQYAPELSKFAAQSYNLKNHYTSSTNNIGATVGLFYGLNASYHDSLLNSKKSSPLLDKLMQEQYKFGLFSADNFDAPLFHNALFRSFQRSNNLSNNQTAIKNWLNWHQSLETSDVWFSYLHLDINSTLHSKNNAPLSEQVAYYNLQVSEIDRLLAQILEKLKENDDISNTLIVITSEQGHMFTNNESVNNKSNIFSRDRIQVPMLIYWSKLSPQNSYKITSHVDILPTIMQSVFHIENPARDYSQGQNVLNTQSLYNWIIVSNERWNVIIDNDGEQYQIDNQGHYLQYNRNSVRVPSDKPPLGLFLEAFTQARSFWEE